MSATDKSDLFENQSIVGLNYGTFQALRIRCRNAVHVTDLKIKHIIVHDL